MPSLTTIAASILAFLLLDGIWLGLVMTSFYRARLAPIARMADGSLAPIWSVAIFIYVLLGLGVAVFVVPRATSTVSAALFGAAFGIVVYGVYHLTNYATLDQWPAVVTLADIVWGTCACAAVSMAAFLVTAR